MMGHPDYVPWRKVLFDNEARPRALFTLWMACHNRLATKSRLMKFGMLTEEKCVFCCETETQNHLLFECAVMKDIWCGVLQWINVIHEPQKWDNEIKLMIQMSKKNSWRSKLLRIAFAETVYACWNYRNEKVFRDNDNKVTTTCIDRYKKYYRYHNL